MPLPSYRSPTEIASAALNVLKIVPLGSEPTADEIAKAVAAYQNLHEELRLQGVALWPWQAVPLHAADGMARMVAARVGHMAGMSEEEKATAEMIARRTLLAATAKPATSAPVQALYF